MIRTLAVLTILSVPMFAQTWPEEVNLAIDRAAHRLLTMQAADGSFRGTHHGHYTTGETALAVYACLKSGLVPEDPAIQHAVRFLLRQPAGRNYDLAALIFALDALRTHQYDNHIQSAAKLLVERLDRTSDLWAYPFSPTHKVDLSNTQFALMALAVAEKHGWKTSRSSLRRVLEAVLGKQNEDGGFGYRDDLRPFSSGAMTTAGLTVLHLVERIIGGRPSKTVAAARDAAWAWLDRNFTAMGNPSKEHGVTSYEYPENSGYVHLYYLYGLERVAALGRRRFIGGRDWYREGALFLLEHQHADGGWGSVDNTSFALLFLRRATFTGLEGTDPVAGAAGAVVWKYTTNDPPDDWMTPEFDDGPWREGAAAFGSRDAGGAAIRTEWPTGRADLRARRWFDWFEDDGKALRLFVLHDDDAAIWINGVEAARLPHYSVSKYVEVDISEAARATVKRGRNLLAIHGHNVGGARSLDVKLVDLGLRTTRAGEDAVARRRRWWRESPSSDVPFIERWLVLGPIGDPTDGLLHVSMLPDEEAEAVPGGRSKKGRWKEARFRGGLVDFGEALRLSDEAVYYAFTWLEAQRDVKAVLRFGADDGFKVFLDGTPLLSHHGRKSATVDDLAVPIVLEKGMHRLLVKVGNATGASGFYARITDREGALPRGLRPRLDPRDKDLPLAARAHPACFEPAELHALLPIDRTPKLDFRTAKDLDRIAVAGAARGYPYWLGAPGKVREGPHPGGRGMLALACSGGGSVRVHRRLDLPGGAPKLRLRVSWTPPPSTAAAKEPASPPPSARLRVGLHAGEERRLLDETLTDAGPAGAWRQWDVDLAEFAGRDVLVTVEATGPDGAVLWIDDLTLKRR